MNLLHGDCLEQMKSLPDNSVDCVVTDPPYGIKFMSKKWDYDVPSIEVWQEVLRVLKPGGHAIVACGTRTQHRMAVNLEDAGFEIRDNISNLYSRNSKFQDLITTLNSDQLKLLEQSLGNDSVCLWGYGSGFPKSHNIGISVDKVQGNEREDLGKILQPGSTGKRLAMGDGWQDNPRTSRGCSPFEGWGTALKPAVEFFTICRKPVSEKTIALNALKWGTGGINIDACRVETTDTYKSKGMSNLGVLHDDNWQPKEINQEMNPQGRFPANLIHDNSDEVLELFPNTKSGKSGVRASAGFNLHSYGKGMGIKAGQENGEYGDQGSAARFFYCPKVSKSERNAGLEGFEEGQTIGGGGTNNTDDDVCEKYGSIKSKANNFHPTVKPVKLMEYLCRMFTPVGGVILDPFMGSGSTGIAATNEGFDFIGIELDKEYHAIATARINHAIKNHLKPLL